jgi:hypothetical protein
MSPHFVYSDISFIDSPSFDLLQTKATDLRMGEFELDRQYTTILRQKLPIRLGSILT